MLETLRMLQGAPGVPMDQMPDMHEPHVKAEDPADSKGSTSSREHPAEHYDGPGDHD